MTFGCGEYKYVKRSLTSFVSFLVGENIEFHVYLLLSLFMTVFLSLFCLSEINIVILLVLTYSNIKPKGWWPFTQGLGPWQRLSRR
jgi:hypothetical protein